MSRSTWIAAANMFAMVICLRCSAFSASEARSPSIVALVYLATVSSAVVLGYWAGTVAIPVLQKKDGSSSEENPERAEKSTGSPATNSRRRRIVLRTKSSHFALMWGGGGPGRTTAFSRNFLSDY